MRMTKAGRRGTAGFNRGSILHARAILLTIAAVLPLGQSPAADEPRVPAVIEPCIACHSYQKDEPLQEAPPLWGVVGRRIASVDGFEYSPALKAVAGSWNRAMLDRFLANPRAMVPGTQMKLGGIPDPAERAAVLDYLERLAPEQPAVATGQ